MRKILNRFNFSNFCEELNHALIPPNPKTFYMVDMQAGVPLNDSIRTLQRWTYEFLEKSVGISSNLLW